MFFLHFFDRVLREDKGRFDCPECHERRDFTLVQIWKYAYLLVFPVGKHQLKKEGIQCDVCQVLFPVTILTETAVEFTSPENGKRSSESFVKQFGNVVELTEKAVVEIRHRQDAGQFHDDDIAVRVTPDRTIHRNVIIQFDFVSADGSDWIGSSGGVPILIDRGDADELQGCTIDYRNGEFVRTQRQTE